MRKYLLSLLTVMMLVLVSACGGNDEVDVSETESESKTPKESEEIETADVAETEEDDDSETEQEDEDILIEKEKNLVETERYTVDLEKVERVSGRGLGEEIVVHVKIENNSEDDLDFFAMDVSADGEMIPLENIEFSQSVKAEKKAKGKFYIHSFDDYEIPELNEDLTIDLIVTDEDYMKDDDEHELIIKF